MGVTRRPSGTNADEGKFRQELARITVYVPTEAIGVYVALLAIRVPPMATASAGAS